jgi:large subunit ribosomal protein L15
MADILSKLQAPVGAVTKARRIGRGVGSGLGKTSGRGQKGQKARSKGNFNKVHFQGGQTPMQRRLPKRGFRNPFGAEVAIIAVGSLDGFEKGASVDEAALRKAGLLRGAFDQLKVLGDGELTKALTVTAHKFSKSAKEKIEKAGGKAIEIAAPSAKSADSSDKALRLTFSVLSSPAHGSPS